MDIFKLFFNHDQRLDELHKRNANKTPQEVEATLADFMKPDPIFSKFYLTGSRIKEEKFGINQLNKYKQILDKLNAVFDDDKIYTSSSDFAMLSEALEHTPVGPAIIISKREQQLEIDALEVDQESNVGHFKTELCEVLMKGDKVLYKEQAQNGFDLHLFSKQNIYSQLFYPMQKLVDDSFRFFSINSKRMRSERHFYFETWTLDKPPHGAEEVFAETML